MVRRELVAWVASVPSIGPYRYDKFISILPNLECLLSFTVSELVAAGLTSRQAEAIVAHRLRHTPEEIAQYCQKHQITIITREDLEYPKLLREIADPPIVLYVKGNLPSANFPKIGVVGTRQVTDYGKEVTKELTTSLAKSGFVIVSGFMYGVDACAHRAAIDSGGQTIGVLGFGFDFMYPKEHVVLAREMLFSGNCLVTEYPFWQAPAAGNFPARNRIVSGMCKGVLVTEAASKSGSKITARLAAEQGREVFAVPGQIHSPFSEGTKELVNLGAKLVTNVNDILEELV